MADKAKVKDGDFIEMDVSIAGDNMSWAPGQVLRVGTDIDANTAQAFVTKYGDDAPRAHPVDEQRAQQQMGRDEELEPMGTEEPSAEDTREPAEPEPEDEVLAPVLEAIAEGEEGIQLDEEQREAAAAFVDAHPDDVRSAALQTLLAKPEGEPGNGGEEDDVEQPDAEQRDEPQGQGETATSPQAETRETATQKRGKRTVKPPDAAKKPDE